MRSGSTQSEAQNEKTTVDLADYPNTVASTRTLPGTRRPLELYFIISATTHLRPTLPKCFFHLIRIPPAQSPGSASESVSPEFQN
jgi:hypothetical protein